MVSNISGDMFLRFDRACLDSEAYIGSFSEFQNDLVKTASAHDAYPLAILDITYHDFKDSVLTDSLVYLIDDKYYDNPYRTESPYLEKDAAILWIRTRTFKLDTMRFWLDEDYYITNRASMPDSILIDFGDGNGFRSVEFNQLIVVDYTAVIEQTSVRMKIKRSGEAELRSLSKLGEDRSLDPCSELSLYDYPDNMFWLGDTWEVTDPVGGAKGNMFVKLGNDYVFDKPFIFVEGVDFGYDDNDHSIHEPFRNGTFGWCEFYSGFLDPELGDENDYRYDMLQKLPLALDELIANGYDLVLVDFYEGAQDMVLNSQLLQHMIGLCNENKVGNEPLVIIGPSMGGQISRHALCTMEKNNVPHCCRLWISFDSPHSGAYISLSLQSAIKFLGGHGSSGAQFKMDHVLGSGAAKQLLNYQVVDGGIAMRNTWYNDLDELGYPQHCRRIAVSNGNDLGIGLSYTDRLLDYSCSGEIEVSEDVTFSGTLVRLLLDPLPGVNTFIPAVDDVGDFIKFPAVGNAFVPADLPNYDYSPGGTTNSIRDFVVQLNKQLDDNILTEVLCPHAQLSDYHYEQTFMSTPSALGLNNTDPYLNVADFILENPNALPFDSYVSAPLDETGPNDNERHTEITDLNTEFILTEVLADDLFHSFSEIPETAVLSPVSFNYGRRGYHILHGPELTIHDGGELHINDDARVQWGLSGDEFTVEKPFMVYTLGCTPVNLVIEDGGLMEIGDENNARRADVYINEGSQIMVKTNGTLRVNSGSNLLIREGAELHLETGAIVVVEDGGTILIEDESPENATDGGRIICEAGGDVEIGLHGDAAVLRFDKGTLHLAEDQEFSIENERGGQWLCGSDGRNRKCVAQCGGLYLPVNG